MSQCSSERAGIVVLERNANQVIYMLLVASCSMTVGMCMESTWCTVRASACEDVAVAAADTTITPPDSSFHSRMWTNVLNSGMVISAGLAAFTASLVGLKSALSFGSLIMTCGTVVVVAVRSTGAEPTVMYVGRLLQGMGAGVFFVIVPNYASEVADTGIRGALSGLHHVHFLIGIFASRVMNCVYFCDSVDYATLFMSLVNFVVLLFVRDPPYYRLKFNRRRWSEWSNYTMKVQNLKPFRKRVYTSLTNISSCQKENRGLTWTMISTEKKVWHPLLVNVCLITVQQLSGFVTMSSKLRSTYEQQLHKISAQIPFAVAVVFFQILMTIVCLIIVGVIGRKGLLTISGFGMAIALDLLNIGYDTEETGHDDTLSIIFISMYMLFFSIGFGPVPWILMPEICPRISRLWTSGVTVSIYAMLNIFKNWSIFDEPIIVYRKDGFLLMFTVVSMFGGLFAYLCVPEKKTCVLF